MYAIVNNGFVVLTQSKWNSRMFTSVLLEDCGIDQKVLLSDEAKVPWEIDQNTKIIKVSDIKPDFNSKTQWLDGPTYTIIDNVAVASYEVKDLDLSIAKGNLKSLLPAIRYGKENKIIQVAVDSQTVSVSTDRENRAVLTSKILSVGTQDLFSWKFPEGWVSVNQADLENIVYQINIIVQQAFDWELSKMNEIDACASLAEIDAVEIYDVVVDPNQP